LVRTRSNLPTGSFSDLDEEDGAPGQFIVALARGLKVLRSFDPLEGPLGNQEIAAKTGLPKPTVSRITYTLAKLGYIDFLPKASKYQLGSGVLALGTAFLNGLVIRRAARPHMERLAEELDVSVSLGIREKLAIAYVDVARGPSVVTMRLDIGTRLPIDRSISGATFLVGLPPMERQLLEAAIIRRNPEHWEAIKARLADVERQIEKYGFAIGVGVYERGMNAVSATFHTPNREDFFVFNVTGPASELSQTRMRREIGPKLTDMIAQVRRDWLDLIHR
jgi:DNA-binding IclR family transcriptional regulator